MRFTCGRTNGELADGIDGEFVLAGDLAYCTRSMRNFIECFDPAVGLESAAVAAVPGNHEYETPIAAGLFPVLWRSGGQWPLLVPRRATGSC